MICLQGLQIFKNSFEKEQSITPLSLTKMWLFWYAKDFRRKIRLNFVNYVNYEISFFNQKIIFLIINKNRILIPESIPLMQNPPGTRIVTKYPNSHTYPNSHHFFGLTKMWLFGDYSIILRIINNPCFMQELKVKLSSAKLCKKIVK